MRVDEGSKCCSFLGMKRNPPTAGVGGVGGGERLLGDPGLKLRLGREKEQETCGGNRWDEQTKRNEYRQRRRVVN